MALASTSQKFTWHFRHQLDGKGRLTIPARWRFADLRELHCGPYRRTKNDREHTPALVLLTEGERQKRVAEINSTEGISRNKRNAFLAALNGSLAPCPMDANHRILIPAALLEKHQLGEDLTLRGVEDFIEVWRSKDFEASQQDDETQDLDAEMAELGW